MNSKISKQQIDPSTGTLFELALSRGEGVKSANGALVVETGKRTGRSPQDKFIVRDATTDSVVDWGDINRPMTPEAFERLWSRATDYLATKEQDYFTSHLCVGADQQWGVPVKVTTETAWHQLFARHLFIGPNEGQPHNSDPAREWTLLNVPGLPTDPTRDGTHSDGAVMLNFTSRRVLICGMRYAGEMKKAMFTVLNFALPDCNVLPMHCAANVDEDGGNVALFFGLSGTGKTTLSSDPERYLIGDDEHGWSPDGVFNFEGGCYAKCINLSKASEPVIWDAIGDGAIMENVVLDPNTHQPDFADDSLTQNTRAASPLSRIQQRVPDSRGATPRSVLFLTCDLYGVLPPLARLTKEQAAYYFLSGYTAKVGSTEIGSTAEIQPTFSACFGAAFFPRSFNEYGELLMKRIDETGANVYLVNTGWMGGGYGTGGKRFSIKTTRSIVKAIVSGALEEADFKSLPGFNISIPTTVLGVDDQCLDPRNTWENIDQYHENAKKLIVQFQDNFKQFKVLESIQQAGPSLEDKK